MLKETIYKELFTLSEDGMIIASENVVLLCNDALVSMLGYDSQEELTGCHPSLFSPKQQPDGSSSLIQANANMAQAIKDDGYRFEWLHSKKSGETIWCEVTLKPLKDEEQTLIFATLRDISDRKVLELANHQAMERFELAFSGSNDGMWDWDLTDDNVYFSPRWKSMLGYADDELENRFETWRERVHPEDLPGAVEDIENYMDQKSTYYENYHRMEHKDGSWVWILDRGKALFDAEGKMMRFIGTHTDVTKEKELEKELMELNSTLESRVAEKTSLLQGAKEFLEMIFNTTKDAIAIIDSESNFMMANAAYFTMTGFGEEELYKTSCLALTADADKERSIQAIEEMLEVGHVYDYRKSCFIKDEKMIDVIMDIVRMPDEISYLLVVRDITSENRLKKEKDLQEKHLLQQSRLAQMGEMISMIAHQWRQPLGAISTTAVNLQMKLELEAFELDREEGRASCGVYFMERLGNIDGFVQNLTTTIDDFRGFYRPNKETVRSSFEEVTAKALNVIKGSLENDDVEIVYRYDAKESLLLYENEMMQVILNILKNAQDNFKERVTKAPQITIMTKEKSIEICDNGGGIADEIIGNIFDPYFSTKSAKNGTGLGLYMSKIIIEDHHNGTLVASNTGDGVCFKITLGSVSSLEGTQAQ